MKTIHTVSLVGVVSLMTLSVGAVSYAFQGHGNMFGTYKASTTSQYHGILAEEQITTDITTDLVFMREEEKLARDVYLTFADLYSNRIFSNIAASEQQHMDKIGDLLETYGIADSIIDETPGVFTNSDLQTLYDDLTTQGSLSLSDALDVGVQIETLDIADLEKALGNVTAGTDIHVVYTSLLQGSEHHLQAFSRVGNNDTRGNNGAGQQKGKQNVMHRFN